MKTVIPAIRTYLLGSAVTGMTAGGASVDAGKAVAQGARIPSLDCLRGLIMVLMALDHARDYAFDGSFDPLDLGRTTVFLFFTRWVTHFCAPLFVFLAGTGAFLFLTRGRTRPELGRYLAVRGAILVAFELLYISLMLTMSPGRIVLQVLWALGLSMIILSFLIRLPDRAILAYGLVLVLGHNLFDGVTTDAASPFHFLWSVLHQPDRTFRVASAIHIQVVYPLIPWTGVMALGYLFGRILLREREERIRILLWSGAALTLAFFALRYLNVYGDPSPWFRRSTGLRTFLTFINTTKYPPSLSFLLMTLGPGIFLMGLLEKRVPRFTGPLTVFGGVPMFFYLAHFPVLLGATALLRRAAGAADIVLAYASWITAVAILYPACRRYHRLKRESPRAWMKYI